MSTEINIPIVVDPPDLGETVNAFKDLKNQLREARGALAALAAGTPEFIEQADRVGQLNDQIANLNANVAAVSGTPIENLSGSFGLLSGQVSSLNFEDAATSLRQFGTSAGQIKLKDLGDSFKSFGKVAFDVGKLILLNPLFLIPALIIGIGAALFVLKDKVKFLGDAFDFIGKVIGSVVQNLKDFGDMIGATSFAAEEAAEKQIAASKKTGDAIAERYDTELKLAKAAGQDTKEIEKRKGEAVRANIRDQIQALVKLALVNGEYSDEQLKQLEEFKTAYKTSLVESTVATLEENKKRTEDAKTSLVESTVATLEENKKRTEDAKKNYTEQLAANKVLQKQIQDLQVQNIKDEDERAKSKLALDYIRGKAEIEQSKGLKSLKDQALFQLELDYQNKLQALEDKKTADAFAQLTAEADAKQKTDEAKLIEEQQKTDDAFAQLSKEADEKDKRDADELQKAKDLAKAKRDAEFQAASDGIAGLQGLSDLVFSIKFANLKKGSAEEEKAARKQFQINKGLQLAQATISGTQSVLAAYASGAATPLIGPVTGAAFAVIAGAVAAANIAKIAATQYTGGSSASAGGGASVGGGSIPVPSAPTQPSPQATAFNPNAGAFDPNTINKADASANNQPIKVYVSESDISKTQRKVSVIESQSTF